MKVVVHEQVEKFLNFLTPKETAKFLHTVELLEQFGHELGLPHSRHIGDGLLELRIPGKRSVRVFYHFSKKSVALLHAYIKKTQKAPDREISAARSRMKDL